MSTVLVVEDSPSAREVVLRLLARQGYNAVGASNATEALDAIQQSSPDLVLLDVMMPGMDGLSLLERLRADPTLRELPVILMTALSDEKRMAMARKLGVCAYLVKSRFSYDDLLQQIDAHIRHAPPTIH